MFGEIDLFLVAVFVAVLFACCVAMLVGSWLVRRRVRQLRAEFQVDLDRATADAAKRIGDEVEIRVRQGVRDGLRDGVTSLPSLSVLEDTTRTVARTGADLIGEGLGSLLGGRRDRPRR